LNRLDARAVEPYAAHNQETTVIHRPTLQTLALSLGILLLAATGGWALDAQRMDPAQDTTLTRPPQHLRVFFNVLPDPAKSELTLVGPEGELKLEGLHTMGENDLMVRIVGRVADGEYTAHWRAVGTDGSTSEGEWKFVVKRAAGG
jgi:methionine-rich copper-binding protein CopC